MGVRSNRGFTLLELLVVITIMALVIGVTSARYSGSNPAVKLKAESRQLVSHLRHTRVRALSESRILSVSIVDGGQAYQVDPGAKIVSLSAPIVMTLHPLTHGPKFSADSISFYPDGSSSGGSVTLSTTAGESTSNEKVDVNWITGEVSHAPD